MIAGLADTSPPQPPLTPNPHVPTHPARRDLARFTADANDYGERRSAQIPLSFTTSMELPVPGPDGRAVRGKRPGPCAVFLHIQVGDPDLSLFADHALPVLIAVSDVHASTAVVGEVIR